MTTDMSKNIQGIEVDDLVLVKFANGSVLKPFVGQTLRVTNIGPHGIGVSTLSGEPVLPGADFNRFEKL